MEQQIRQLNRCLRPQLLKDGIIERGLVGESPSKKWLYTH